MITTNDAGTWMITTSLFAVVCSVAFAFAAGFVFAHLTDRRK